MDLSLRKLPAARPAPERRREIRLPAEGEVLLAPETGRPDLIHARLVDVSASGFRAAHNSPLLENGLVVSFRYAGLSGVARVVWNRVVDGRRESGFFILQE